MVGWSLLFSETETQTKENQTAKSEVCSFDFDYFVYRNNGRIRARNSRKTRNSENYNFVSEVQNILKIGWCALLKSTLLTNFAEGAWKALRS